MALGFYISAHPLDQYKHLIKSAGLATSDTLDSLGDRKQVHIAANVGSFSRRRTKTGKDMITINASDSMGNIDAVAFGDSSIELAKTLENESVVLISGRTSKRDDRTSIFVDSIIPLTEWVAKIAKKVTLHITNSKVLPNVKKSLASLPKGPTKVELHLHSGDGVTKIRLGGGVELGATTATDMAALGIKMEIE